MTNSGANERRYFLSRLLRNPLFAVRHVPVLSSGVFVKISNLVRLRLAGTQRGLKRRARWLPARSSKPAEGAPRADFLAQLPRFAIHAAPSGARAARAAAAAAAGDGDPEDYLLTHRWRFLVDALLGAPEGGELERVAGWIEAHRDRGAPEWETYSSCERLANLLLFLSVHRGPALAPAVSAQLARFMAASLEWIESQLEYYGDATNNHLINNGRAMVMGGVALGDARAFSAGMGVLRHTLPRMVGRDGFLRERSSHYQLIVTGWVLDSWAFARHAAPDSDDARFLQEISSRMARASALLLDGEGGLVACIGDVSPDASPAMSAAKLVRLYPESRNATSPSTSSIADGWFRVNVAEASLIGNFPAGEFPLPFPTHGHADHGSFVWLLRDRAMLDDPGRYRYSADPVSEWQRRAAAHNTVLVDGFAPLCGSMLPAGEWWPRPYARAHLDIVAVGQGVQLRHDGFARATRARIHSRTIRCDQDTLNVIDEIEGKGEVVVTFCWFFGAAFTRFDAAALCALGSGAKLALEIEGAPASPVVSSVRGEASGGWSSREYGRALPALSVALEFTLELPARITTRFRCQPCAE